MSAYALEARGLQKAFGALVVAQDVDLSLAPGARRAGVRDVGAEDRDSSVIGPDHS